MRFRRKMSSVSGSTTTRMIARKSVPNRPSLPPNSRLLRVFIWVLRQAVFALSATHLAGEETLRANHEDDDDGEKSGDFAHRSLEKEFGDGLRLRDAKCRGHRAQHAGRAAEHHDE